MKHARGKIAVVERAAVVVGLARAEAADTVAAAAVMAVAVVAATAVAVAATVVVAAGTKTASVSRGFTRAPGFRLESRKQSAAHGVVLPVTAPVT